MWTAHLDRYRDARTDLTAEQRDVLRTARALLTDQATFERGLDADLHRRLRSLSESAVSAFGENQARDLLATLGPPERISLRGDDDCTCSSEDDWCDSMVYCENEWACDHVDGCGSFWPYTCDGLCTTFD